MPFDIFEPSDLIARLAALVPKSRVNLTRFHGLFAPNSKHRALVDPARRGRGNKPMRYPSAMITLGAEGDVCIFCTLHMDSGASMHRMGSVS